MSRGDATAAHEHVREAAALAREADNPRCLAEALRFEADLLHAAGKFEAAREAILQALEHLEQGGEIACEEHLVCTAIAAAIERALGNEDNARLLAQSAVEMIDRHRNNPDPDVRRAIAGLRALVG